MTTPDHYQLLGVAPDASRRAIRVAYRRALLRYHPDANAGKRDGEEMLRRVLTAGRILGNPREREKYDRHLAAAVRPSPPTSPVPKKPPRADIPLEWSRILRRCALAGRRFLTAAWAQWTDRRTLAQRQHRKEAFDAYLRQALQRNAAGRYRQGEDGIYRQAQERAAGQRSWQRRTAIWLLLGVLEKIWGRF